MRLTFKNNPISLNGTPPQVGDQAPEFTLIDNELKSIGLANFAGKRVILNVFPSVDTAVCALQLQKFNSQVASLIDTALVFASLDLPFAFKRFCAAEGIDNAVTGSDFHSRSINNNYKLTMQDGPLAGLYARAVFVLDASHLITHAEVVSEVTDEPDYEAALAKAKA